MILHEIFFTFNPRIGKEYPVTDLSREETVAMLKHEIAKLTNVRPERQKLLNLKYKGNF